MHKPATSYISGYYDCYLSMRREPPATIEVTEDLYQAYLRELEENALTLYGKSTIGPSNLQLYYKGCRIRRGFSGWNARALSV